MQDASLRELVVAAQAEDRQAFEVLAARYRHGVFAVCLDRCGTFETAEDLTQETLIQAWRRIREVRQRLQ